MKNVNPRRCKICNTILKKQKSFCSRSCMGRCYTGQKHTQEALSKMRGRRLSRDTIEKQNLAKKRENVRVEGHFVCRLCEKSFSSNTSLRSHKSYCTISEEKKDSQCHLCKKLFESERSLKIHSSLVHVSSDISEIRRQKMVDAKKNSVVRRTSKAEDEFFNSVFSVFPDAVRHFLIPDHSHVYDIYIPSVNVIIEFDGDFWHGNKKLFELTHRMKQQYKIDEANVKKAIENGYKIVRVWQSESSEFVQAVKEKLCLI